MKALFTTFALIFNLWAMPQILSFAEVKEYLLRTEKAKIGAVGKILRKDGSLYGFQIIRLPKESLFYQLGARKGDIILRIETKEEIPLSSNLQLYRLLWRLEQEEVVAVTYERDGRKFRKIFKNQKPSL